MNNEDEVAHRAVHVIIPDRCPAGRCPGYITDLPEPAKCGGPGHFTVLCCQICAESGCELLLALEKPPDQVPAPAHPIREPARFPESDQTHHTTRREYHIQPGDPAGDLGPGGTQSTYPPAGSQCVCRFGRSALAGFQQQYGGFFRGTGKRGNRSTSFRL